MTLFTTTNYPISSLIDDIDFGKIGLPELQRPFVWPNVNVRNLFDSIYRGYPAPGDAAGAKQDVHVEARSFENAKRSEPKNCYR